MTMEAQQPQPTAPPQPRQPQPSDDEGFEVINPTLAVFAPTEAGQQVRGFILGRQFDPDAIPFYVLQLTEPCELATRADGACQLEPGAQVVVYETDSIKGCGKLMPNVQATPDGQVAAHWAFEVVFETKRHHQSGWHYIARARRIAPAPIGVPAPFTLPDVAPSELPRSKQVS